MDNRKALGRCAQGHVKVVVAGNLHQACDKCGKPLIEWSKHTPAKE